MFDDVALRRPDDTAASSSSTARKAPWSPASEFEGGNMGHRPAIKGGYFPVPPVDSQQRPARRDAVDHGRDGPRGREAPPRGGAAASTSSASSFGTLVKTRRQHADLQVLRAQRRAQLRQDGDLHAEADLRRQRLGHARPPVDLEGRQAAVRRHRLCRPVGDRRSTTSAASSSTPRR